MSVITKPVGIHAVASALGVSSYDLGTLCQSANMWAKYKPLAHPTLGELSHADMRNAFYGFNMEEGFAPIAMVTSPLDLPYNGQENGWNYNKPGGLNLNEPYRLLDFNGYKSDARNPVENYEARTSLIYDPDSPSTVNVASFNANVDSTGASIELDDLKYIIRKLLESYYVTVPDNLYFGVILAQGKRFDPDTWTGRQEVSCSLPIVKSEGAYQIGSVAFSTAGITATDEGIWTVIPFFSLEYIAGGDWSHLPLRMTPVATIPYAQVTEINIVKRA